MRKKKQKKINGTLVLILLGFIWITFNQSGLIKLISLHQEKNQLINDISILENKSILICS